MNHKTLANVLAGGVAAVCGLWVSNALALGVTKDVHGKTVVGRCGTVAPEIPNCPARVSVPGPVPRRTMFVNRNGGQYAPGPAADSITNTFGPTIPNASGGFVPAAVITDDQWADVMQCVRGMFAPFNIDVVDVEPSSGDHVECVVGGTQDDIGYMDNQSGGILLGIASADSISAGSCAVNERGIAFAFSENHGSMASAAARRQLCITIAHEMGHVLGGMNEGFDVEEDIMSYSNKEPKAFVDKPGKCGSNFVPQIAKTCSCNATENTQNSYAILDEYLGPNDQEPPTLTVSEPAEGDKVGPGFKASADASDNFRVVKVDMVIDGEIVASDFSSPFELEAPKNLAVGALTFDIVAYDKSSNTKTVTRSVTVEPGCTGPSDCAADEQCVNQVCLGDVGHDCTSNSDCVDGLCVAIPGAPQFTSKFCTKSCDASDSNACPSGFACDNSTGGATKCNPADGGGGCGCRAGARRDAAGASGLAAFALLAFVAFRARRRTR